MEMSRKVNRALEDIERELADLECRREELDRAIARLQRVAGCFGATQAPLGIPD